MLGFVQDDIPWLAVQDTRVAVGLISIQCIGDDVLAAKPWLMNIPCSTVHNASIRLRFFAIIKRVRGLREGMINRKTRCIPIRARRSAFHDWEIGTLEARSSSATRGCYYIDMISTSNATELWAYILWHQRPGPAGGDWLGLQTQPSTGSAVR